MSPSLSFSVNLNPWVEPRPMTLVDTANVSNQLQIFPDVREQQTPGVAIFT